MNRTVPPQPWLRPAAVWLIVLATIFATEYAVMLTLPWALPGPRTALLDATVDSVILTVVLAPVIWWTVVHPLREVVRLRTQFVTDLFDRIEADRRRTAHELHDGVGQSLSLLVSGLRSAQKDPAGPESNGRSERQLGLAQAALQDVKRLARGLRPSLLDDLGLAPALERLVADVREHHPIDLSLDDADIAGKRLPEAVETAVFRIVQEALANVVTHAKAGCATVAIRQHENTVAVQVSDDGCGMDCSRSRTGHLGLIGMSERATLLGGEFSVDSAPGRGTRITVTIPILG